MTSFKPASVMEFGFYYRRRPNVNVEQERYVQVSDSVNIFKKQSGDKITLRNCTVLNS